MHSFAPFSFFSARRIERCTPKRPNTIKCSAVKCTLLGTRYPRKEKEAALQNKIVEPACLWDEISVCHSSNCVDLGESLLAKFGFDTAEKEPSRVDTAPTIEAGERSRVRACAAAATRALYAHRIAPATRAPKRHSEQPWQPPRQHSNST